MRKPSLFLVVLLFCGFVYSSLCGDPEETITIKSIKPFAYAAIEMSGSYDNHGDAFMKLFEQAGSQGVPMDGIMFGVYYNNPYDTPEEELKWDVGLPAQTIETVEAPLVLKKWEFETVAVRVYEGPVDDNFSAVYMSVITWIPENGYTVAGPVMERFLTQGSTDENGVWSGKIEINIPVLKQ